MHIRMCIVFFLFLLEYMYDLGALDMILSKNVYKILASTSDFHTYGTQLNASKL